MTVANASLDLRLDPTRFVQAIEECRRETRKTLYKIKRHIKLHGRRSLKSRATRSLE